MQVVIVGGTGFIGPHVARRLAASGHNVTIFHRGRSQAALPPSVRRLHGERARLLDFRDTFRALAPEVVLDMHAMTEREAELTMHAFRGLARRVVAISSMDVYRAYGRIRRTEPGPPDLPPLTERSPLRERLFPHRGDQLRAADAPDRADDDYDKILVERAVLGDPALPGTIMRVPQVHGPGDPYHRLYPWVKRMTDERAAILLGEEAAQWRATPGYVGNIAAAIALAVTHEGAVGRIYNVGEAEAPSNLELARRVGQIVGWTGEIVVVPPARLPPHLSQPYDYRQHFIVDTARIRQELGYAEPAPWEDWLPRTIAWQREHPPAEPEQFGYWVDYPAEDAVLETL